MDRRKDTAVEAVLEQLIEHGPGEIASVFARAFDLAMQIERERFPGAGYYERTPERHGYANGTKPKRIYTPAGTVNVQVPKTAGHDGEPYYPQSLERGRRSVSAVMMAVSITRLSRKPTRANLQIRGHASGMKGASCPWPPRVATTTRCRAGIIRSVSADERAGADPFGRDHPGPPRVCPISAMIQSRKARIRGSAALSSGCTR